MFVPYFKNYFAVHTYLILIEIIIAAYDYSLFQGSVKVKYSKYLSFKNSKILPQFDFLVNSWVMSMEYEQTFVMHVHNLDSRKPIGGLGCGYYLSDSLDYARK